MLATLHITPAFLHNQATIPKISKKSSELSIMLSPTCSSLGFGSGYVHQLCLCHPIITMVILILLVWRIGFGVTGLELAGVMPMAQGCCLV
jgi:hypothetical protein